jgi:hypothetical protein
VGITRGGKSLIWAWIFKQRFGFDGLNKNWIQKKRAVLSQYRPLFFPVDFLL